MAVITTPIILSSGFEHIGGNIGNALAIALIKNHWIRNDAVSIYVTLTTNGEKEFQKLGIDTSQFR